jgi:hypothetical protein
MKKTRKIFIIITAAVSFAYFFLGREDFIISDLEWACDARECKVVFDIANRSDNKHQQYLSIRAFSKREIGKGAEQIRIIGEKKLTVSIAPFERKQIQTTLSLSGIGPVHHMTVNALEIIE